MELELDLEDLLNKRKIKSDRIEFKASWNPDDIYRSICAFANDYNNDGGGYIVVGVEENRISFLSCQDHYHQCPGQTLPRILLVTLFFP